MSWLFVAFEAWLTARLLRSPLFHRGVGAIHKKVQELKYGKDPSELGGTNIDDPNKNRFLKYFMEEIKEQFRNKK